MKLVRNRKVRIRSAARRRPINVLASVMTTMNLYCGVTSIFASMGLEFEKAAYCILAGVIFDTLDGFVARLTHSTSEFGKELDSLCDVVTFGVAPAVLVFAAYLPPESFRDLIIPMRAESIVGKSGSFAGIIFAICAALRLARYNTFQATRRDSFVGLPSPAAGCTIATFVLFLQYFEQKLEVMKFGALAYYALGPMAVVLALLMVSRVLYPRNRLKAFVLAPRHAFTALGSFAFIIAVLHYALTTSWSIVLFPVTAAYVLFGVCDTAYLKLARKELTPQESAAASPPPDGLTSSAGAPPKKDDAR